MTEPKMRRRTSMEYDFHNDSVPEVEMPRRSMTFTKSNLQRQIKEKDHAVTFNFYLMINFVMRKKA